MNEFDVSSAPRHECTVPQHRNATTAVRMLSVDIIGIVVVVVVVAGISITFVRADMLNSSAKHWHIFVFSESDIIFA